MSLRRRLATIGALAGLVLAGCAGGGATPAPTVTPTVTADKTAPPEPVVPTTWPLTGIEGDVHSRPAVAVKIENTPAARPQTGLEHADVVWEQVVEGGISRFVVVFHSQAPREVGPIRSVRPADASIASPLRGPFAFSGGQGPILARMAATPLQLLSEDAGDGGFFRVRSRRAPHNLYGSVERFTALADAAHAAPPGEQFAFALPAERSTVEEHGTPATTINLRLSAAATPRWAWDDGSGRWLRSEGTRAAVSATGERLAATNVVVIVVESFDSGFDAQQGVPVPDLRLVGSGSGTLAAAGRTVDVTWSKADRDAPLVLTGPDGEPALLRPGNTWVELVPRGTGSFTVG